MYASLGLTALACIVHELDLHGLSRQVQSMSLDWMLLMATLNVR